MVEERRHNDERIAVLETEVQSLKEEQDKILQCVQNIHAEMVRYKGFLGGIAFIVSGIGIFLTVFRDWLTAHIK